MKILFKKIAILSLIIIPISCKSNNNENSEIRLVNLEGKFRPIKIRVPDENAKILQDNKISPSKSFSVDTSKSNSNSKSDSQKTPENSSKEPINENINNEQYSNNKTQIGNQPNNNIEYNLDDKFANKSEKNNENIEDTTETSTKNPDEIELNLAETTNYSDKNKVKNTKKILNFNDKNTRNKQIFTQDYPKESSNIDSNNLEDPQNLAQETTSKNKQYYIQIGSFSSANHAREKLNTVKNFQKGKVIIGYNNNQRVYRSVYGPFKNKALANKSKNRLNNMGVEAILIKK
jgi:cell division protein FtsN